MKQLTYNIDPYTEGLTPRDLRTEIGIGTDTSVSLDTLFELLGADERQLVKLLFGLGQGQHGTGTALGTICLFHLQLDEVEAQRRLDLSLQRMRRVVGSTHFQRAVGAANGIDPHDLMAKAGLSPVEKQVIQRLFMLSGLRKYTTDAVVTEFAKDGFTSETVREKVGQLIARLRDQVTP